MTEEERDDFLSDMDFSDFNISDLADLDSDRVVSVRIKAVSCVLLSCVMLSCCHVVMLLPDESGVFLLRGDGRPVPQLSPGGNLLLHCHL